MDFLPDNPSQTNAEVTVVIPAYNHSRYVTEAIDSVRNQTFSNWKIIIIDDGSTDETWAVLNSYQKTVSDSRIQIFHQHNAGSHATINRAISLVQTPYLAILNSDDIYAPDRLERLIKLAKSNTKDVFIVTGVRLIDENSSPVSSQHWWQSMYQNLLNRWQTSQSSGVANPAVDALLWGNFTVSTSNFFMSLGVWQRVGQFRHLRYVPDWDYALRVAAEFPSTFIFLPNEELLSYRLHGQNTILGGALRNHAEAIRVLRSFQKMWIAAGNKVPQHAVDRLYFLNRFMRHEHTRQLLEAQKVGWLEQVEALEQALHQSRRATDDWKGRSEQWEQQATEIINSSTWRFTAPFRRIKTKLMSVASTLRTLKVRALARRGRPIEKAKNAYEEWLKDEAEALNKLKTSFAAELSLMVKKPLISIVLPVHNTPVAFLKAAIASVQGQWYDHWEICICNDASTDPATLQLLQSIESADHKIRCVHRVSSGHIVLATNDAIQIAKGEFIVLLDHDDLLAPQALFMLIQALNLTPDADLIYSDEDKINENGIRCLPFFKPDWSPTLLWSQNYIGHLMCLRSSTLTKIGGFLEGTQGSQDHDLVLRLAAHGAKIVHVPHVLYHWRIHAASTSSNPQAKPYAHDAGREAVRSHLSQRYKDQFNRIEDSDYSFVYLPRFNIKPESIASIIIPTLDKSELLKTCIDSIRRQTVDAQYEIIIIDNGSKEEVTKDYFRQLADEANIKVVNANIPFNWSQLNNIGRQHARGQVLVFLNNDTEVITPDWLQRLMEYALLPDVATVGPLLLYPDDTIQHAGVVVGMGGWADHVFKAQAVTHYPSPFVSSILPRNVLAVTGACMAIATEHFDQLGGFDEAFQICGSDVELGIRAHLQGYLNVYLPTARLYHLESKTRSPEVPDVDFQQSAIKYAPFRLEGDPFYNRNLDMQLSTPTSRYPQIN
jgi:glycosyltransferase involved in cell wall biosynthesis